MVFNIRARKRLQSQFSLDHWGEIKKKPLTLMYLETAQLARRSALSTFLREADMYFVCFYF